MALQPLSILLREQNAQGHCFFLVLLARTHRPACTNSLTSYLIYSPKIGALDRRPQRSTRSGPEDANSDDDLMVARRLLCCLCTLARKRIHDRCQSVPPLPGSTLPCRPQSMQVQILV